MKTFGTLFRFNPEGKMYVATAWDPEFDRVCVALRRRLEWSQRQHSEGVMDIVASVEELTGHQTHELRSTTQRLSVRPGLWEDLRVTPENYVEMEFDSVTHECVRIDLADEPEPPLWQR